MLPPILFGSPIITSEKLIGNEVFAWLLCISSTLTQPSPPNSTPNSSMMVSQTNSQGGDDTNQGRGRPRCTYYKKLSDTHDCCYLLHDQPPRDALMAQSSDPPHLNLRIIV